MRVKKLRKHYTPKEKRKYIAINCVRMRERTSMDGNYRQTR